MNRLLRLPRVICTFALLAPLPFAACTSEDTADEGESSTTGDENPGDGDGDPTTDSAGDGDGDPTTDSAGDGDGDPGDGDGDPGDGDGDPGDGDGDPGDGDGDPGDGDGDVPVEFSLTSPAYEDGGVIPMPQTCAGANISPQLDWVGAPEQAQSFAVFFTDVTFNFDHSAIWDIPVDLTGLPEAVEREPMPADVPGASQALSYIGWHGYAGPCPPQTHSYQFILYALDVPTVQELDTDASLAAVQMALQAHAIAQTTLEGEYTP